VSGGQKQSCGSGTKGSGDFEQAVAWQEKAIAIAPPAWRMELEMRLKLYREGKPYRDPIPNMLDAAPSEDSKNPKGDTKQ